MFGEKRSGLDALLHRPRPSAWQLFLQSPCVFLARKLYSWRRFATNTRNTGNAISIVCISDTHNSQCALPSGDILIHAGDLTQAGSLKELQAAISWLQEQPHQVKIAIAGNHELLLDPSRDDQYDNALMARRQIDWGDIYPKTPRNGNWEFHYPRQDDVWKNTVPEDTDVLITHGPPQAHLDLDAFGFHHLLREVWRVRPALHIFGHVHEGYGHEVAHFDSLQAAYERVILTKGGIWNLLGFLKAFTYSLLLHLVMATCQLVNPSLVGGLRDDLRRKPIKVYI
ncbi:Metallo-dependent phosphatase [Xylariaceae sp. FL1651]|nr:Metallo-dependent phosphatase [Xylariaceae sp. FL1651]